ncbi:MAG TPA: hypothetical protein VFA55_06590 [Candidatus Kapabacteria bacterium]|nr:hypothetical protein [Candidatus Kapabacteria bacterium]
MAKPVSAFVSSNVIYGSWTNDAAGPIPAGIPFTITDTGSTFMANSIIVFFQIATTPTYVIQNIIPDTASKNPGHGHHEHGGIAGSITVVASQPIPVGFTVYFAVINPA